MKALNLRIVFVTFIVTVALTLSAQRLWYHHRVTEPLQRRIEDIPGIADAQIIDTGIRRIVAIRLEPEADFRSAYRAARDMALDSLGHAFSDILVLDNRDQKLEDSFYKMHFHVQQGIATGQFTEMADGVSAIAREDELTHQHVYIGEEAVYIHLSDGEHHLYEVINRPSQTRAVLG
ncbi:MAG: hypothetical protein GX162_11030 [Firmicutes bacterium]|nr:hypothetical protein [Bacillota bacterium]